MKSITECEVNQVLFLCASKQLVTLFALRSGDFQLKKNGRMTQGPTDQLDFIRKAFSSQQLDRLVEDMTTAVIFGFYLGERYYKPFEYNGQMMIRPMIKFLSQRTIEQWSTTEDSEIHGVVQRAYGDDVSFDDYRGQEKIISGANLVHFAINQEGDNHEGISFLRACYMSWARKNIYYRQIATGTNFLAIPYLILTQDVAIGHRPSKEQMKVIADLLRKRVKDNKVASHIILPVGFKATEMKSSFNPELLYKCNAEEDQEIIRAFNTNFLLLTQGSGSFALSNDLSDFWTRGLEAIAMGIDMAIDKGLVMPTIKSNFDQECMVECVHSEVGGKGGPALADSLNKLLTSRAVRQDESLEEWVREKFGMPEIDFETRQEDDAQQEETQKDSDSKKEDIDSYPEDDSDSKDDMDMDDEEEKKFSDGHVAFASVSSMKKQANASVKRLKKTQDTMRSVYKEQTTDIVSKKMAKLRSFLKKNKIEDIPSKFKAESIAVSIEKFQKSIEKVAAQAFNEEFNDVTGRIEMASKRRDVVMMLRQRSYSDVDALVKDLDIQIITALYDALKTNDVALIESVVEQRSISYVGSRKVLDKATVTPSLAINEARQYAFDEVRDQIESFTYYNESPVAEICKYLAGKTIDVSDPDQLSYQPPLHFNCATVVIPNMKSWRNNPKTQKLTPNQKQVKSIQVGPKAN